MRCREILQASLLATPSREKALSFLFILGKKLPRESQMTQLSAKRHHCGPFFCPQFFCLIFLSFALLVSLLGEKTAV